ncbi:MAG: phage portal protein, partial [bacterium]
MKVKEPELVKMVLNDPENLDRLSKDMLYLRYYLGDHDILHDPERKERNRLVLNHCMRIVETSVAIMKGLPLRVVAPDDTLEALDLDDSKATSIVRNGSLFGNSYALVWFDKKSEKFKYTELLDMESFPLYSPDTGEMEAFIRYYAVKPLYAGDTGNELGKAWIYRPDSIVYLEREGFSEFVVKDVNPNPLGEIPVVHFRNRRIGGE